MPTDGWVRAALADDELVVELLFRLKQQSSELLASQKQQVKNHQFLLPPLGWGQRQPRSKLAASAGKKNRDSIRCSPTTPLSWSCGAGTSTSDESSRPSDPSSSGRSKGSFAYDTAAAINKRSKRKKTFAELKEEESSLLKERVHLNKELASLRVTVKEQQARGNSFKRFKLNLCMPPPPDSLNIQQQATKQGHAELLPTMTTQDIQQQASSSFKVQEEENNATGGFVIPDLNMVPDLNMMPTEDSSIETLYGFS